MNKTTMFRNIFGEVLKVGDLFFVKTPFIVCGAIILYKR